jgi:predicted DNA binding CopG/RHH family protein
MKNLNLDDFEQDILDSVENNEWQSKGDIKTRLTELQGFLKNEKKKAISIRLSENDLYELKRKSLENGVPYQNIIQILVHQYTSNKIHLDVS